MASVLGLSGATWTNRSSAKLLAPSTSCVSKRRGALIICASNDFRLSSVISTQRSTTVSIEPSASGRNVESTSTPVIALAAGGVAVLGFAIVAWRRFSQGASALTGAQDVLKTVQAGDIALSDEQILAARARRSKERANHKLTLEEIELPDNHPWATKHPVTKEDDAKIRARLSVRRGVPPASAPGVSAEPKAPLPRPQRLEAQQPGRQQQQPL